MAQSGGRRERQGARRRFAHLRAVPLQAGMGRRQSFEDRTGSSGIRQRDLEDADFRGRGRPDLAAERLREELMPEAKAKERHPAGQDSLADGGSLGLQPWVSLVLPHVHGATHHPQCVEVLQVGNRLPVIQFNRAPCDSVLSKEIPEYSGVFDRDVLKHQNPGLGCGHGGYP